MSNKTCPLLKVILISTIVAAGITCIAENVLANDDDWLVLPATGAKLAASKPWRIQWTAEFDDHDDIRVSWSTSGNDGSFDEIYFGNGTLSSHFWIWPYGDASYPRPSIANGGTLWIQISSGSWDHKDKVSVTIDSSPPADPSFTSNYSINSWYTSASPTFSWSCSATDISHYNIYFGGSNSGDPSTNRYSTSYPPPSLTSSGTYYFRVQAEDNATSESTHPGNTSGIIMQTYNFDKDPPTNVRPVSTATIFSKTSTVSISWIADDSHSGISGSYSQQFNTGNGIWQSGAYTATDGATYTFRAMTWDKASNPSAWSTQYATVTFDFVAPSSNATGPTGTTDEINPTITWNGSDPGPNHSGIASYHIERRDVTANGSWETVYDGAATSHTLFNAANPGVNGHIFEIRSQARDGAGNVEVLLSTADISFKIEAGDSPRNLRTDPPNTYDDPTPTFKWESPSNGASAGYLVSFESGYNENIAADPSEVTDHNITYTYQTKVAQTLSDGWRTFCVKSNNGAGVWTELSLGFFIDTQPPTIEDASVNQNGGDLTLNGAANDAARVDDIQYQLLRLNPDNTYSTAKSWASIPGDYEHPSVSFETTETVADGTYKFAVKAIDYGNHESAVFTTGPVTIDASYPTIVLDIGKNSFTGSSTDPVIVDADSPFITTIKDGNGIDYASLTITGIDNGYYQPVSIASNKDAALSTSFDAGLGDGKYMVDIVATSEGKQSELFVAIQVYAGGVRVLGKPYTYPNPFKPGLSDVTFRYELTRDSDIKFLLYNMTGKPVQTYAFGKGQNGGKAGINAPTWDGKDNFENIVANGPYYYFIIVDGKVIGRGEMAAFQ